MNSEVEKKFEEWRYQALSKRSRLYRDLNLVNSQNYGALIVWQLQL